jgi:hypothetical protein
MKLRSIVFIAAAILLLTSATALSAVAEAKPATLHLNAVVYDAHLSKEVFSSKEKLFQGTAKIGEDYSRCAPASRTTYRCNGTYLIGNGSIQFAGTISRTNNTNTLKITGGTGTYKGARGTVLTEYNKAGTRAKETLTFT